MPWNNGLVHYVGKQSGKWFLLPLKKKKSFFCAWIRFDSQVREERLICWDRVEKGRLENCWKDWKHEHVNELEQWLSREGGGREATWKTDQVGKIGIAVEMAVLGSFFSWSIIFITIAKVKGYISFEPGSFLRTTWTQPSRFLSTYSRK